MTLLHIGSPVALCGARGPQMLVHEELSAEEITAGDYQQCITCFRRAVPHLEEVLAAKDARLTKLKDEGKVEDHAT